MVEQDGTLRGVICQSDLVAQHKHLHMPSYFVILDAIIPLSSPRKFEEEVNRMTATTVEQAMSSDVRTVSPDATIEEIASVMAEEKYYTLPVVEAGRLVGVVGKEDVLRTLAHA